MMQDRILKCVVVDDSSLQRLSMGQLIKKHPLLELASEFSNALRAKEFLKTEKVDLIFLDVEMPLLSGFDMLDGLEEKPGIIFVTGKTQYAFEAFNHQAIDFLQKPVDKNRFDRAVEKAIVQTQLNETIEADLGSYIFIKSNLKKHKVYVNTLRYVEAMGDYAKIVTDDENYVILSTMKAFEKELPHNQFMRIHKSYIINLGKIKSYDSKYVQLEEDNIPLSRHKKEILQEALTILDAEKANLDPQLQ